MKLRNISHTQRFLARILSTNSKIKPKFDFKLFDDTGEAIKQGSLKPRNHAGSLSVGTVTLPNKLTDAATLAFAEYPEKNLKNDAKKLTSYLWSRHPPLEVDEYKEKLKEVEEIIRQQEKFDPMSPEVVEEDRRRLLDSRRSKVYEKMKRETYNWRPIIYDKYKSSVYAVARMAPDFASLVRILNEIKKRDSQFSPRNMLDFGSGVGTSMWVVDKIWPGSCKEAVCVDASGDMNDLADLLLRGGDISNPLHVREGGTFFKQFLPMSDTHKYDLVLSSRTLFELPDMASRLRTIDILWRKTSGYLIIVEAGTKAGYRLVLEARDYVLELSRRAYEEGESNPQGYVFAPCSHDKFCPVFFHSSDAHCNFSVSYKPYAFGREQNFQKDVFSYVVLKRGNRDDTEVQWPRVVRLPIHSKKHIICRTCTRYGTFQELTATKRRQGNVCYKVFKKTSWGDLLPIELPEPEPIQTPGVEVLQVESDEGSSDTVNKTEDLEA